MARAAHDLALKHYKHLLAAEEAAAGGADVQPLDSMHWRRNPLIRSIYLAFEQDEAQHLVLTGDSKAFRLQRVLAKNLGDSRLIENTHQHGRDLYRSSKSSSFSNPTIFANALRSGALEERKVPCLKVSEQDKAIAGSFRLRFRDAVNSKLRSQGHKLPKDMQLMMVPKSKTHTWPSPAPSSLFGSAAATQWLFSFYGAEQNSPLKAEGVNGSWVSVLAMAGRIVGQSSTSRLIKVLATAEFGFLGADILPMAGADGGHHLVCSKDRKAVQWHHVVDLDDWFALPVEPSVVNARGPLGWKRIGDPMPLEVACCLDGVQLVYLAIKKLIKRLGGKVKGTPSKKALQMQLIEMVLPDAQQEEAKQKVGEEQKEEDYDTDFSEVVSELGQEDGNAQDLKEYKDKKKARRLRRNLSKAPDEPVPKAKAKTGKGRGGKGRGKGKGKGKVGKKGKKGKGKRRGLLASLLDRAQKQKKEELEGKNAEAAQPAGKEGETPDQASKGEEPTSKPEADAAMGEGGQGEVAASSSASKPEADAAMGEGGQGEVAASSSASKPEADAAMGEGGQGEVAAAASSSASKPEADAAMGEGGQGEVAAAASSSSKPKHAGDKIETEEPLAKRQKKNKSPQEVLDMLQPPGCKFTLGYMDHRFSSKYDVDHPGLEGKLKQKTFSKTFVEKRSWKEALKEVHAHNWGKWQVVKDIRPLPTGVEPQEPGVIADETFEILQPTIDALKPVVRYDKI